MKYILILLIKFYRTFISPVLPRSCRFYPSCSQYALDSLNRFGLFKGIWLSAKRIFKCHPFHSGGFDPVPKKE